MSTPDDEILVQLSFDGSQVEQGSQETADLFAAAQAEMSEAAETAGARMKAAAAGVAETESDAQSRIKAMVSASLAQAAANNQNIVSERALREAQGLRVEATDDQIAASAALRAEQDAAMGLDKGFAAAVAAVTAEEAANTAVTTENAAAQGLLNEKLASGAAVREYSALVDEALRGRFTQMTGTVATLSNRLGFMSALFSPMGAAIGAAAGVLGLFIAALVKGTEEETKFEQAIQSTGNVIGMTTDQLHALAEGMANGHTSISQANEALLAAANSGRTTAQNLQMVASAAVNMAQVTGVSVKKAVEDFTSLQDKPLEAAIKLNEQYHFLTEAAYDQIAAFEKAGLTEQAAAVAQQAFADAFSARVKNMEADTSTLGSMWESVTNGFSNFWTKLKENLGSNTLGQQIATLDSQIEDVQRRMQGINTLSGAPNPLLKAQLEDLETQKAALEVLQKNQQGQAAAQGSSQQQTQDYIDYSQMETKAQAHENKLTEIKTTGLSERLAAGTREMKQLQSDMDTLGTLQAERAEEDLQQQTRKLQQQQSLGQISKQQELDGLRDLENQKYELQLEDLQHQMELQPKETEEYNKLLLKKEQLLMQHQQRVGAIEDQMVQAEVQRYRNMLAPINSAISASINGIIQGTTSGKQALANLGMSMVDEFIGHCVTMLTEWLATEAGKTAATSGSETTRSGIKAAAAAQDRATVTATSVADVASYAAVAAAAAASSVAEIPIVGWAMAPGVAAETYASTMAYAGLASASGGWEDVPAETLTMLHPHEMVLPADVASGARQTFRNARGGGEGKGGGETHVHFHQVDTQGVKDMLRRNPHILAEAVAHASRRMGGR